MTDSDATFDPQELMDYMLSETRRLVGQTVGSSTIEQLVKTIKGIYSDSDKISGDAIEFELNPEDSTECLPKNLYTLLLMMGIFVKYEDVKDKQEYITGDGSVISFKRGSAIQTIKPATPLKFIRLDVVVNKPF